jgi:hypothetical protein
MKLREIITAVQEKRLDKDQLGQYRDELANVAALIQLEMAELEKKEALYFIDNKQESDIATKRAWKVTKEGQRMIELAHYFKACEKILSSLKSRLYETY